MCLVRNYLHERSFCAASRTIYSTPDRSSLTRLKQLALALSGGKHRLTLPLSSALGGAPPPCLLSNQVCCLLTLDCHLERLNFANPVIKLLFS